MVNQDYNEQMELKAVTHNLVPTEFLPSSGKFIISKGNRIPFIICFTSKGTLQVASGRRMFRRQMDTDSILQIFISGSHIVYVPIRRHTYYVGKGILMDQHQKILAMLTVSEEFYHHFQRFQELTEEHIRQHFTLVISKEFESAASHKTLHAKFRKFYKNIGCNKSFTIDPEFESFTRISLPSFESLQQRQVYINSYIDKVLEDILTW